MNRNWIVAGWLALVCAAGPITAQMSSNPTAEQIVARHIEAMGGSERWDRVDTLRMSGSYVFNGETRPLVVSRSRPASFRFEMKIDGVPYIIATDGEKAWRYFSNDDDHPILMKPDDARRLIEEWADFEGPLVDYAAKGHQVQLADRVELDGVDCYQLDVTLASGGHQTFYISTDDYRLVRKITQQIHARRGPYDRVWYYESYQDEDGLLLPQYFEREDRQHVRAYDFNTYAVNVEVPNSEFAAPSNARLDTD